ncbi:MAG: riboflavin synthase, partial [Alphaproteobacteria bacterium]
CLTVTAREAAGAGALFSIDVSNETLAHTTLGAWQEGDRVNLERSLHLGDEMGGHIVTGHVDAVTTIEDSEADGDSRRFRIALPAHLAHLVATKGSVALDGVSLTVNDVDKQTFGVNIVPHTLQHTTWGLKRRGDRVNLEVDLLARYVARITETGRGAR